MSETPTQVEVPGGPRGPDQTPLETIEAPAAIVGRSPWELFWRAFRRDRWALAGVGIIVLMLILALSAPLFVKIVHHGQNFQSTGPDALDQRFGLPRGPSKQYWFGVETGGYDLFIRVLYGARTSLTIAFVATGIAVVIGVGLGLIAGFYRGKVDTVVSRATDVVLSLPILLLAVGLASACGTTVQGCLGGLIKPGLLVVELIIGLFSWPYISRIVRGQVLSLREKEFIEAARSLGAGNVRIMVREVLPNVTAAIIVYTTLIIPSNILFEAGLSFLGVGVPQGTASWGQMISEARGNAFVYAPWLMIFPGLFLFATTLAFNLVGDGLRDALDPRTGGVP
jgi:peptide/nickel transport system permease protein